MADFKYLEIAKALEESIGRGDYQERLPGVRLLASAFGVNPRTARRALEVLVNRGTVLPDGNRGCLLPKPHQPRRQTGNVIIYSNHPVELEGQSPRSLLNCLADGMEAYDLKPVFMSAAREQLADDMEFWLSCKVDGFIFVFSSFRQEIASQMALRRIPVVAANRMEESLKISWVDFDHEKAVEEMLEFMIRAGHRRIALLNQLHPYAFVRGHFEQAYRKTMQRHRLYDPQLFCFLETRERQTEEVNAHIERIMALPNPPTAILCGQLERDAAEALRDYPVRPILVPTCDVNRPDTGTRPRLAYSYLELGDKVFDVFRRVRETGAVIQEMVPMRIEI
jgi:DNA-binding LacI/PurR family transcriptional regulator